MSRNFELLSKALREDLMQVESTPREDVAFDSVPEVEFDSVPEELRELPVPMHQGAEGLPLTNLVQRVFLGNGAQAPRMVGFAAVETQAGCSWVCAHVSKILAAHVAGSVCAVDANLRTPALHTHFAVTNPAGLSDALLHAEPLAKSAHPLFGKKLWLVSAGSRSSALDGSVISERMRSQIAGLRNDFDYVLLDLPPLNRYADAIALGGICDGLILVLRANASRRDTATKALADLKTANVNVLGVTLNQRTFSIPDAIYRRL
jgi:Mrp family chromosome partitioning ATPase